MIFSVFLDIICLIKCHNKTIFTQEIDLSTRESHPAKVAVFRYCCVLVVADLSLYSQARNCVAFQ